MNYRKLLFSPLAIILVVLLSGCEPNLVVFQPQGPVARSIMELINWSLIWMLLVVVVVFGLFGYIVWKYRERPENKDYEPPEEHGSTLLEVIWTAIPILIVVALTIPTVTTLYDLEEVPKGYEEKSRLRFMSPRRIGNGSSAIRSRGSRPSTMSIYRRIRLFCLN